MGLEKLSKMSDDDYKRLSPQDLLMYNRELPEMDYSRQYAHIPYPKAKYQLRDLPGGGQRLVSIEVASREVEDKLVGDWRDSPNAWGITTHPAADPVTLESGFSFDVPQPIEPQVAHTPQPGDADPEREPEPERTDKAPMRDPPTRDDDEDAGAASRPARRR